VNSGTFWAYCVKFTFAISFPDEFLFIPVIWPSCLSCLQLIHVCLRMSGYTHGTDTQALLFKKVVSICIMCLRSFFYFTYLYDFLKEIWLWEFWCDVDLQWCYWRKLIGWRKMPSMRWDVRWRNIAQLAAWFCVATRRRVSFQQYAVAVLLWGWQLPHMTRLNNHDLSICMSIVSLMEPCNTVRFLVYTVTCHSCFSS